MTRSGLVGTLPYMSPEQWMADSIDGRTDLWAVGIILYKLVIGKHPLHPLRRHQLLRVMDFEKPMPSAHDAPVTIAPALADLIDACLKKRRDDRIADAPTLLAALERMTSNHGDTTMGSDERPYAGLAAFQETEANRFFGRSVDITILCNRLPDEPIIGVVGSSGVGKSSFIRAGVIPALKNSGTPWQSIVIRPGRQPLSALAQLITALLDDTEFSVSEDTEDFVFDQDLVRRLRKEPGYLGVLLRERARKYGHNMLLFIDQFEELYTLTPNLEDRLVFSNAITAVADDATSPLRVILSIRSDFLDRVAEDRKLMADLQRALYFLVQPERAGLREAIIRPAEQLGYRFEAPWMVADMLDQLQVTAGALPLLQFAATKLWDSRDRIQHLLTERSYRALGGVEGALATHANAVLATLSPEEQTLVRAIFLQLVTVERTRAIASIAELRDMESSRSETIQRLIDRLVDARLLVVTTDDEESGALVEIVHESLIRSWPMLSHWLDENQEDAPFYEQVKVAAAQWDERGRPMGLVWRGEAATDARAWRHRYRGMLSRVQRDYLDAVEVWATRSARRKWLAMAGTLVFLSVLVVVGAIALWIINDAKQLALAKEQQIRQQYRQLQAEKTGRQEAEAKADNLGAQVEDSRDQLRRKNAALAEALEEARRASEKAHEAAERAELKAEEARAAKAKADALNREQKRRIDNLQRQLGAKPAEDVLR